MRSSSKVRNRILFGIGGSFAVVQFWVANYFGPRLVDVAGHMQKYASPGSLWVGKEVLTELESSAGFEQVTTQMVDGRVPYEWKMRTTAKAVSSTDNKS